ncbi:hypothetical protein J6590_096055, partial [Homalodisca vitripennis]
TVKIIYRNSAQTTLEMVRIRQDIARQIIKVLNAAMNKPESLENKRPRVKERYYSHKTSKACSRHAGLYTCRKATFH